MAEKRKFRIYTKDAFNVANGSSGNIGSPVLTVFRYVAGNGENNPDQKVVTSTSGWLDSNTSIEINTEPLLLSAGSAVISARLAEREVTLEYNSEVANPEDALVAEGVLNNLAMSFTPLVIAEEVRVNDSTSVTITALFDCYITTFEPKFNNATNYDMKLVFKVTKPKKRVFAGDVNSSTVTETGQML